MNEKLHILIIDDEQIYRDEISEFLIKKGYEVYEAAKPSNAFQILTDDDIDVVILDIDLPEMNGIDVLQKMKKLYPHLEVMMITGFGNMETVIKAMRLGAYDFFPKPFSLLDIQVAIERTQRYLELNRRLKETELNYSLISTELQKQIGDKIIGKSAQMKSVLNLMSKVAKSDKTNVLILGESGTGKELVARGIHFLSSRKNKFFRDVNCSAVPETLFESAFFGHKKGAFTGALENETGWFEIANKGTLFLDEIGDLKMELQTKFLRVIEQNIIRRVGSHKDIPIDVRVIAATNKDIKKLLKNNNFREDLYYRLSTFVIDIPPLRERKEDIALLLDHFIKKYSQELNKKVTSYDKKVLDELLLYDFPGNVRELKNMVEKAIILCNCTKLSKQHFPDLSCRELQKHTPSIPSAFNLELAERDLIIKALKQTHFNKAQTLKLLNITRQSLNRRIEKHKIKFEELK